MGSIVHQPNVKVHAGLEHESHSLHLNIASSLLHSCQTTPSLPSCIHLQVVQPVHHSRTMPPLHPHEAADSQQSLSFEAAPPYLLTPSCQLADPNHRMRTQQAHLGARLSPLSVCIQQHHLVAGLKPMLAHSLGTLPFTAWGRSRPLPR